MAAVMMCSYFSDVHSCVSLSIAYLLVDFMDSQPQPKNGKFLQ